jgi:L-fucose isomerase-like protein
MRNVKAGFVGFGEVNTPAEIIQKKVSGAETALKELDFDLLRTDPVSDDPRGREAERAVRELNKEEFDLLVVCIAGWIPSWAVIRITSEFAHKPMLLWGLTGYTRDGRLVTTADQAGTTALRKVFEDLGYRFKYVYESPGAKPKLEQIRSFAAAARAERLLKEAKVGMMGYRDMRLYGTLFDGPSLKATTGVEIEFFEMLEMVQRSEKLDPAEVDKVVRSMETNWQFEKKAQAETLEKAARYFLAVRDITAENGYQAVSLIDVDGMKKLLEYPPAPIFMLLGEQLGVCTIPENDSLGAVTQLMVKTLTGQIAPYFEFYELFEDRMLMGVPDFVPSEIVEGRVTVLPTAFGGFAEGILNVSKVKTGPVTLSRLTASGDRYSLHAITANAQAPRSWEEAGWQPPAPQLPSLEIVPDIPVEAFAQKVLSQHYILAYGDITRELADLCALLGIGAYREPWIAAAGFSSRQTGKVKARDLP